MDSTIMFERLNEERGEENHDYDCLSQDSCNNQTMSNVSNIYGFEYKPKPLRLDGNPWEVLVNGFVSPVLILLTVVTNSLISMVLLQRHMRTPTNLLLVAMAVSDMLTGAFPVPCFVYFYAAGHYRDYVPYSWCYAIAAFTLNLPTVCHTASIWLTVSLAGQRYIHVCLPHRAKTICTISNTIKAILVIYTGAFLSQACRFFEYHYYEIHADSLIHNGTTVKGCVQRLVPFLEDNMALYFSVYWWFRVIFIHLVPCASLVVLNSLLYHAMRVAQTRSHVLLRQNRKSESRRLAETNMATLMLFVVVGVFLLVEFPLAVLFITMIVENTFGWFFMDIDKREMTSLFINLLIIFSYPVNFFIYCAMSRQFRETFKRLLTCRRQRTTTADAKNLTNYQTTFCQTTRV